MDALKNTNANSVMAGKSKNFILIFSRSSLVCTEIAVQSRTVLITILRLIKNKYYPHGSSIFQKLERHASLLIFMSPFWEISVQSINRLHFQEWQQNWIVILCKFKTIKHTIKWVALWHSINNNSNSSRIKICTANLKILTFNHNTNRINSTKSINLHYKSTKTTNNTYKFTRSNLNNK